MTAEISQSSEVRGDTASGQPTGRQTSDMARRWQPLALTCSIGVLAAALCHLMGELGPVAGELGRAEDGTARMESRYGWYFNTIRSASHRSNSAAIRA